MVSGQQRKRLRFLALYCKGHAASERATTALAADPRLGVECFEQLADMIDALTSLDSEQLPVAVVCPGVVEPEQAIRQLLRYRSGLQVALIVPVDDQRSLGEYFRNLSVPARQVELLPAQEQELAGRALTIGDAVLQRAAYQRAIRRTSERLNHIQPRSLDLTVEAVQREMLESLPMGLIVLSSTGYVVQANARARQLLLQSADVKAGSGQMAEHIDSLLPQWIDVSTNPSSGSVTVLSDGQLRHLRVRSKPLGSGSDLQGTVITLEDVTEQEKARRVLQETAEELQTRIDSESRELGRVRRERDAIRDFIITLTHDLRSPLAATDMQLQLLQRRAKSHDADWALNGLERAEQGLRRIDRMVEDLLDVARHDAGGQLKITPRACRLDRLLLEVTEDLQRVHERDYQIRQPLPPISGVWDADGIRRIIENLGNNAAKYSDPEQPITLWLEETQHHAVIHVRNDGEPIPLDTQRVLFKPFYRAVLDGSRGPRGWGVGLAIVRAMTETHGGSVSLVSSEQSGTIFTVTLPKCALAVAGAPHGGAPETE